jgi:hypothetical protein
VDTLVLEFLLGGNGASDDLGRLVDLIYLACAALSSGLLSVQRDFL